MSDIREVWKYWPLKDGFHSISQKFYVVAILWWVDQEFKLLADISFESCLQNIIYKHLFDFSNYLEDSKFFDPVNEKVIGKKKGVSERKIIDEFVGLKSKMHSWKILM